jgi:hypothetical protein
MLVAYRRSKKFIVGELGLTFLVYNRLMIEQFLQNLGKIRG